MKITIEDINSYKHILDKIKEFVILYNDFDNQDDVEFISIDNVQIEHNIVFIDYTYYDCVMHEICESTFSISLDYFIDK